MVYFDLFVLYVFVTALYIVLLFEEPSRFLEDPDDFVERKLYDFYEWLRILRENSCIIAGMCYIYLCVRIGDKILHWLVYSHPDFTSYLLYTVMLGVFGAILYAASKLLILGVSKLIDMVGEYGRDKKEVEVHTEVP